MAITVPEARLYVTDSVLHAAQDVFSERKLDMAIRTAFERFLRETQVARSTKTMATVSGTRFYDLDTEIASGFRPDQIVGMPYIQATDYRSLQIVDYEVIRREYDTSDATGRPEMIGFNGNRMFMFPTPDDAYTVNIEAWDTLDITGWTIGGTDATTLAKEINVPDRWAYEVLNIGARAYLILGAPGHPDAQASMYEFERMIARNKGAGQRGGRWWPSSKGTIEQGYGPRPRL